MAPTSAEENRKAILAKKVEQAQKIMKEFNNRAEIKSLRKDPETYRQAVAELSNTIKKRGQRLEDIKGTSEIQKLAAETTNKLRSLAIQQRQASKSSKTPSSPSRKGRKSKTPKRRSSLSSTAIKEKKKIEKAKEVEKKAKKKAEKKATKEAKKKAKEEAKRKAEAEKKAKAKKLAEEAERKAEEAEKKRKAEEAEKKRLEDEAEKKRLEEEAEKKRLEEEAEQQRKAKQKKDCSKAKQDLRNALDKEGEKLDGAQEIKDIEKVKNVGKELKKFDTAFKGVDNYCKSIVSVADLQSELKTLEKKQQNKLNELEELQRQKNEEAEKKEKIEKEIEDEIKTLTGILNNTIQSGPEFLPKEMEDGKFDRKKLNEYKKRYQDSKGFEEKIDELEELYKKKKEESEALQKSRVKAVEKLSKLLSLQDDNDSYNSFKKAITQATTIKSIDDIFKNALDLNKTLEQKKAERRKKLQQAAKKANNLSNAVKTFEDVLKDKSKADRDALKKLKKDTNSYIYKIIDNAETMLASPDRKKFITFARDTINELLLLETFQESVKRRNKSKYFEGKSLKLRDNTVWKNYRKELYEILKEIILDQNTLLSYFGYAYEFPEYTEPKENPMKPTFSTDKEYAFLKIQYLSVDSVKYKAIVDKDNKDENGEFRIVDIHNLQGTAKRQGYGPKIVKSMLDSFNEKEKPTYIVLSPYLQNNIGLHKVYHDKWKMQYMSINKDDEKKILDFYGEEELEKVKKEIQQNTLRNIKQPKDPLKLKPGASQETYLIISTKDLLKNPKFKKGFDRDTLVDEEGDVERIDLTKEEYKDVIDFTLLKDKENIPIDKNQIRKNGDVQKNLKLTVGWDDNRTHYLYFYPLKPKDETKTNEDADETGTNEDADETKEDDGTKFQPNDTVKRLKKDGTLYAGDYKFIRYDGRDEAIIKNNRGTEISTKIKNIKKKLFDLQSIWDDQEDLMVPPPSSLGLAARKAREFMVFE